MASCTGRSEKLNSTDSPSASSLREAQEGTTKVAFGFTIVDGRITEIELLADPDVVGADRVRLV